MLKQDVIWIRMYNRYSTSFYFRVSICRRCVTNKKPLIESGTMGPKGHTFVVVPHKSESYSNQVKDGKLLAKIISLLLF